MIIKRSIPFLTIGCFTAIGLNAQNMRTPNILIAIADDWSFPHAGYYGCGWISTPAFDYVAKNGIAFTNAYTVNAKSAPSRACLLTGLNSWQLEEAGNHITNWPENKYETVFEVLKKAGYHTGFTGKGWAPGNPGKINGMKRELTGKEYNRKKTTPPTSGISNCDYVENFETFLNENKTSKPFLFWYGGFEPHRKYEYASGIKNGKRTLSYIDKVPAFWPDNDTVRTDMLDYAYEVEYFDNQLNKMIQLLRQKGELDNTIIIVTADNGMPFPRAKGFQYDYSTHLPLAIFWPNGIKNPGRTNNQLISNIDIVPTLYDLTLKRRDCKNINTSGVSLKDIFEDKLKNKREFILLGQERHDVGRPLNQGYPIRSIRYKDFLYIYNFKPQLWPSGNPETGYLNTDGSPTKSVILNLRRQKIDSTYWSENFGFHPQEELYNLKKDRECLQNLAQNPKFQKLKSTLKNQLFKSLKQQKDPRVLGHGDVFDKYFFDKADSWNFYERYMKGEIEPASTNWVNESDYEKRTNIIKRKQKQH